MKNTVNNWHLKVKALLLLGSLLGFTQQNMAADNVPRLSQAELVDVVAPIALYPDDLVAVVLPAASYPLQLVQAQRVLNDGGSPDSDWDEAVVAVMNYPEVVEFMNDDLDWTYSLGLAFINQEKDVFNAIQDFRADALAAGNLKSDSYQVVRVDNNGNILIEPQAKDTLYVPRYEPQRVIVRHVTPVYHYYPVARPVYYYPYPASYAFNVGHFYGVGTYFSIGWQYRGLNLFYSNGPSHPYFGRHYAVRYSPRHYYFKPRVRRHIANNHRHHYKPGVIKRVKHRALKDRRHNRFADGKRRTGKFRDGKFRDGPRHRQVAHKRANKRIDRRVDRRIDRKIDQRLNRPKHRLARNSIRDDQQRKQAKFRDSRRERDSFGRKGAKRNSAKPISKREARANRGTLNRASANRTNAKRAPVNRARNNTLIAEARRKAISQNSRQFNKSQQRQVKATQPNRRAARQNSVNKSRKSLRTERRARPQQSQRRAKSQARGSAKANRGKSNRQRASRASR